MDFGQQYFFAAIPKIWLLASACMMCVLICFEIARMKRRVIPKRTFLNMALLYLLAEYIFLMLCLTVFCRPSVGHYEIELIPFSDIAEVCKVPYISHGQYIVREILLNILMFVPVGIILGICSKLRTTYLHPILIGFCLSLTIEVLQLITCRGCCEINDIIYNTLGCGSALWITNSFERKLNKP